MVGTKAMDRVKARPFEIPSSKSPDFKCLQISNASRFQMVGFQIPTVLILMLILPVILKPIFLFNRLGEYYCTGPEINGSEAYKWFSKAVKHGDAAAPNNLGLIILNGIGCSKVKYPNFNFLPREHS